jgi:hypothetical protein
MRLRLILASAATVALGAVTALAAGPADPWIARARAYLGTETALNSIKSLHFQGHFNGTEKVADPADPAKTIDRPVQVAIDIVFQYPMQQRQTLRSDKVERTTALDDYDGWERVTEIGGLGGSRLTLLDAAGIKRLRATTVENLSFYSDRLAGSRRVEFLGEETIDGVVCGKLSFVHTDSIAFVRYFEKATGRLVKTEIEGGAQIREEGETIIQGVRFPRQVVNQTADGRSTTITFDKITVNEIQPPETFAVPGFQGK